MGALLLSDPEGTCCLGTSAKVLKNGSVIKTLSSGGSWGRDTHWPAEAVAGKVRQTGHMLGTAHAWFLPSVHGTSVPHGGSRRAAYLLTASDSVGDLGPARKQTPPCAQTGSPLWPPKSVPQGQHPITRSSPSSLPLLGTKNQNRSGISCHCEFLTLVRKCWVGAGGTKLLSGPWEVNVAGTGFFLKVKLAVLV